MVFVDDELQSTRSGLLRGDGLRTFLRRWGFDRDPPERGDDDSETHDDDHNPWSNPNRWQRRPIRDRIDNAKERFAWWLLSKWLGYGAGAFAVLTPWVVLLQHVRRSGPPTHPPASRKPTRRPSKQPRRRKSGRQS